MKLGPVTTLDKGNKGTSKNDYDVMPENCDIIVIFPKIVTSLSFFQFMDNLE